MAAVVACASHRMIGNQLGYAPHNVLRVTRAVWYAYAMNNDADRIAAADLTRGDVIFTDDAWYEVHDAIIDDSEIDGMVELELCAVDDSMVDRTVWVDHDDTFPVRFDG